MKFGIDWRQPSTIRGLLWAVGSLTAFIFLAVSGPDKAIGAMTITGTLVGGLGFAVKDK